MVLDKYKDYATHITKEEKTNEIPDSYVIEPNQLKKTIWLMLMRN